MPIVMECHFPETPPGLLESDEQIWSAVLYYYIVMLSNYDPPSLHNHELLWSLPSPEQTNVIINPTVTVDKVPAIPSDHSNLPYDIEYWTGIYRRPNYGVHDKLGLWECRRYRDRLLA